MNEEMNGVDSSPENALSSGDLSNEVEQNFIEEQQKTNELLEQLNEILTEQQLTEEEKQAEVMAAQQEKLGLEEQNEKLEMIFQEMQTMNNQLVAMQSEMPKEKIIVEGNFYLGLTFVIVMAVYMFWNQLSKW